MIDPTADFPPQDEDNIPCTENQAAASQVDALFCTNPARCLLDPSAPLCDPHPHGTAVLNEVVDPPQVLGSQYSLGSDASAHGGPHFHYSVPSHANLFQLQEHQPSLKRTFTQSSQSPLANAQQPSIMYPQQTRTQQPQLHVPYQQQQPIQHAHQTVSSQTPSLLLLLLSSFQVDPAHCSHQGSTQPWTTEVIVAPQKPMLPRFIVYSC